mmetsp:Transcript_4738/g.4784  ORF Transcript_4738/g.4784 Transcript_4738/m.4784 type:complete len:244 (-) Transcript_4738:250-981(-)
MSICQFWYAWLNGFSGEKMYTEAAIQFFNLFYTSLPIILLAVYDMDIQRDIVYRFPQLYEIGVKNLYFNASIFWWQIFNAIVDAVLLTFLPFYQLTYFSKHGVDESLWHTGALIFTAVVILANIKAGFLVCQWTFIPTLIIFLSIGSWFLIAIIVSNAPLIDYNWYFLWQEVLSSTTFWLSLICVIGAILVKDLYLILLKIEFNPSKIQIILESDLSSPTIAPKRKSTENKPNNQQSLELVAY